MSDAGELRAQFPEKLVPLFTPATYKIAYGGRVGMKSWGFARALILMQMERSLRVLCTREIQKSIRDSVHRLLGDQIQLLNVGYYFDVLDQEIRSKKHEGMFLFSGLSDHTVESIKSYEGVDIAWLEEAQTSSRKSLDILIPTIVRKPGAEVWMSMNPGLDTDPVWTDFIERSPPNTILMPIGWRDNPFLSAEAIAAKDHMRQVDPVGYENVWEGKPRTSVDGAIYANEIAQMVAEKRITRVPYDPALVVHTVWDIGYANTAILLAQRSGQAINVIDYVYGGNRSYSDWIAELRTRRYVWGSDWLPHDGKRKEQGTKLSAIDMIRALGREVHDVPNDISVEAGINAARMMFPRVAIDSEKCGELIESLKRYRRDIPVKTGEPGAPLHDRHSHGADAWRYLSIVAHRLTGAHGKTNAVLPKRRTTWV